MHSRLILYRIKKELEMNKLTKRYYFVLALALIAAVSSGCVKKPDKNQVVAQINNYSVTIDDFKHEARMSIPGATKELILQDIITKELLLQEAQKMDLDKNKIFMKEIEDYWKQSLIKRLINIKGAEFLAAVKITDEEMKISGQTKERLKMEKAQVLLGLWIDSLKNNAKIDRYDEVFNTIKIKNARNLVGGSDGE
jgi:hypothetical protein